MPLLANNKSFVAVVMMGVMLLAAAAPLCLMTVEPAMAMPAATVALDSDCPSGEGGPAAGSMAACPYEDSLDVAATAVQPRPDNTASLVIATSGSALPALHSACTPDAPEAGAPPSLTAAVPLRI